MLAWTDRNDFALAVVCYGLSSIYSLFLWRKGFRQDDRWNYLLLLMAFVFHTMALVNRGFSYNRCPVSNLYEAITFVTWTIVACYVVIGIWPRLRFLGAFASPMLFGIGVFALFPNLDVHGPRPEFLSGWSSFHAALILLAYGAFGLAAVAGLMYLSQQHDLKFRKIRAIHSLMPPIQRLERVSERMMLIGWCLLTVGLILGGVTFRLDGKGLSLWDVKVVWSVFVCGLYLTLVVMRWRFALGGRRFAWAAIGAFTFVLLTFWGTNLMSGIHQS